MKRIDDSRNSIDEIESNNTNDIEIFIDNPIKC